MYAGIHMQESPASEGSRTVVLWSVAVYLVAFIPRILRAWESREDVLLRSTPDDAYYYFAIARNIIQGNGASFDGEHVTNGFHPLWQALITPLWVFGGDTPIHLALSIGAIFGGITAVLVFLFLYRATQSLLPALLGAGFFALHPQSITDSVNGLESAVSVMLLAALLFALTWIDLSDNSPRSVSSIDVGFGVLCGLLLLARTDMVFVVGVVLLYVLVRMGRSRIWRPVAMGATALVLMVPWFAWSLIATGSVLQISGRAGGVYFRDAYIAEHGDALSTKISHGFEVVRVIFREDLPQSYFVPATFPEWATFAVALAGAMLILTAALRNRGPYADAVVALAVIGVGFALSLVFHGGVRWFTRTWYYTPAALLGASMLGLAAHGLITLVRDAFPAISSTLHRRVAWAAYGAIAVLMLWAYEPYSPTNWAREDEGSLLMHDAGQWLAANTPKDARAGSFNAGIIGYFSERTVVNLDGVVNEGAYHAIAQCRMTEYVREERLDYVVDFSQALWLASCGPKVVEYEHVATLDEHPSVFGVIDVAKVVPAAQ